MSKEPLKKPLNRAEQVKTNAASQKGIRIYDIDLAISNHMINTVTPTIVVNDEKIKIPIIYGNPERWKSIQRDGVSRDKDGKLITPLIMFKRNTIDKDDSIPSSMNRHLTYSGIDKYSKKHRYDLFSQMTGIQRPVEQYNIIIPDYVTVTYEVVVWTSFVEQMNTVIEAYQYATDEYWGDKDKFRFKVEIDSFDNSVEIGEGTERTVKSTFNLLVHAYLLPEKFNNEPTTKKAFTIKQVRWSADTTT